MIPASEIQAGAFRNENDNGKVYPWFERPAAPIDFPVASRAVCPA
jgi:hypothetical protein